MIEERRNRDVMCSQGWLSRCVKRRALRPFIGHGILSQQSVRFLVSTKKFFCLTRKRFYMVVFNCTPLISLWQETQVHRLTEILVLLVLGFPRKSVFNAGSRWESALLIPIADSWSEVRSLNDICKLAVGLRVWKIEILPPLVNCECSPRYLEILLPNE